MRYLTVILSMLLAVEPAFAQLAAEAPKAGGFASFIPLIVIVALFYFLMLRPQLKQQKAHDASVKALEKNDKVILASGIEAVITNIDEDNKRVTVKIADGVEIKIVHDGQSFREKVVTDSPKAANDTNKKKPKTAARKVKAPAKKPKAVAKKNVKTKK